VQWLVEQAAELVSWHLEQDCLTLEIVLCSEGDLPSIEEPVMVVRLVDPVPPEALSVDLEELAGYLWGVGTEDVGGRTSVTLEGEGYSVVVPCQKVDVLRRPLERRHYERVFERHKAHAEWANDELQRFRSKFRRVEVFLEQQATRAERIIAEVSSIYPESRVRAEARLDLVGKVANILKGEEPKSKVEGPEDP
jgi:hypothetical protein